MSVSLRICLLIVLSVGVAACGAKAKDRSEGDEVVAIPVDAAVVDRGTVTAAWRGTATLRAEGAASVVARTSGIVEAVMVEEGDRVERGQPLARLDTERLALEAARAKAQLDKLVADVNRAEQVHQRGLISNEQFEQLRFELASVRAAHELAALSVREAVIRAPFAGVISRRHLRLGNQIASGTTTFDLVKLEPLEADLFVPERDLGKLQPGHAVRLRVDAFPNRDFQGQVVRVSPVVDAASGTVKVTAEMTPGQADLKPGMFGRVEIHYDQRDDVARVPVAALLTEDARPVVFVIEDGHAHKRGLTLGYQEGAYAEVIEGLAEGDQVVITGQSNLKDNAPVTVVGGPAATLAPTAEPG